MATNHSCKPYRTKVGEDAKMRGVVDSWHYHENGGIEVHIQTKYGHARVVVPARSIRAWAAVDSARRERSDER